MGKNKDTKVNKDGSVVTPGIANDQLGENAGTDPMIVGQNKNKKNVNGKK